MARIPLGYTIAMRGRNLYDEQELQKIFEGAAKQSNNILYLFTRLKKKTRQGSRIDRTAGKGTWLGQQCKSIKNHSGTVIGRMRMFVYKNRGWKEHNDQWNMKEYVLVDDAGRDADNGYVLCLIKKKKDGRGQKQTPQEEIDGLVCGTEVDYARELEQIIAEHSVEEQEKMPQYMENWYAHMNVPAATAEILGEHSSTEFMLLNTEEREKMPLYMENGYAQMNVPAAAAAASDHQGRFPSEQILHARKEDEQVEHLSNNSFGVETEAEQRSTFPLGDFTWTTLMGSTEFVEADEVFDIEELLGNDGDNCASWGEGC